MHLERFSRSAELANFVRVRRLRLNPKDYGIGSASSRRRTPGLRREELGELAGISADWIARLEQGREIRLSRSAVHRLSDALRLCAVETEHMLALCDQLPANMLPTPPPSTTLSRIVARQGSNPAYVTDSRGDILTYNKAADLVFGLLDGTRTENWNSLRFMFLNPDARDLFDEWEHHGRRMVAQFRLAYDRQSDSGKQREIIEELRTRSSFFDRLWAEHNVLHRSGGRKVVRHPEFGTLVFDHESFRVSDSADLIMTIFVPAEGHEPNFRALEEAVAQRVNDKSGYDRCNR